MTARLPRRVVLAAAIAGLGLGPRLLGSRVRAAADEQLVAARYRLLVFSRTAGFRHDSIPDAVAAVGRLGDQNGFLVDATEDPSVFTDAGLADYSAVSFLLTTGDVLDDSQQAAFERYIGRPRVCRGPLGRRHGVRLAVVRRPAGCLLRFTPGHPTSGGPPRRREPPVNGLLAGRLGAD